MGQRFLLRGTTGRKRAATRARPRRCLASNRQKESLSIASVGLPDRASWCPRSHRCCARVTRVTAARLLTLEAVATCGHDCDRLGFTDTANGLPVDGATGSHLTLCATTWLLTDRLRLTYLPSPHGYAKRSRQVVSDSSAYSR